MSLRPWAWARVSCNRTAIRASDWTRRTDQARRSHAPADSVDAMVASVGSWPFIIVRATLSLARVVAKQFTIQRFGGQPFDPFPIHSSQPVAFVSGGVHRRSAPPDNLVYEAWALVTRIV